MTTATRAENLGKQYLLRHAQQGHLFVYGSLGKSLANGGKAFCIGYCILSRLGPK